MTSLRSRLGIAALTLGSAALAVGCFPDPGVTPTTATTTTAPTTVTSSTSTSSTSTTTTTRPTTTITTTTTTTVPVPWEQAMLADLNAKRSANGVAPLTLCGRLMGAAQVQSADMAARRSLGHVGGDGSSPAQRVSATGYSWTAVGENVAAGQTTVTQVMDAFFNEFPPADTGHRDNILDPAFVHVGVARATAANGTLYWAQDFAAGGECAVAQ